MKIMPNIQIIGLALYFDSTIVIADIHIGYEEALNKQGVLVPRLQFEEIVENTEQIFKKLKDRKIKRIIVNGDLKHEFGTISEQEWRNTLKFLDLLFKHCDELVLIKGNHDTILGPIAKKRNISIMKSIMIKGILITHGDHVPTAKELEKVATIIIGHEHPAISLKEGPRAETFKCFLKGKFRNRGLIVQPSFNTMIEGTDVLKDETLSPLLKQNLDDFEVFVVEDKVYDFGKLGKLKKKM